MFRIQRIPNWVVGWVTTGDGQRYGGDYTSRRGNGDIHSRPIRRGLESNMVVSDLCLYAGRSLTYNDVTISSKETRYWGEMIIPEKAQLSRDVESIKMVKRGGPYRFPISCEIQMFFPQNERCTERGRRWPSAYSARESERYAPTAPQERFRR